MKTGKSLQELAAEIERQSKVKQDFVADTRAVALVPLLEVVGEKSVRVPQLQLVGDTTRQFPILPLAHRQIGDRVGVPAKYYDRLLAEAPDLLATNVNHWLQNDPEKRLIRTLDGQARAFLSNSYQRIDHFDVASVVLPVLGEIPGIETVSTEITESRLYIKAVTHKLRGEVSSRRVGDVVEGGVMITNSETGQGAVSVKPFAYFLWCLNGAVRDKGFRAAHLGRKSEVDEHVTELLSDSTKALEDRTVLAKVRDVVRAAFDEARFRAWIDKLNEATTQKIGGDVARSIEVLGTTFALTGGEQSDVLRHLIEGADLSKYGLMNAVTRTATDATSYDRATELETIGPSLIELPLGQWREIARV